MMAATCEGDAASERQFESGGGGRLQANVGMLKLFLYLEGL